MKFRIIIICSLLMLFGCSLINGPNKTTPISFENYQYPLEVGNKWTYERTFTYSNLVPDTVQLRFDLVQKGSATVEVIRIDTISDSLKAYNLHTIAVDSIHPNIEHTATTLVTNEDDGFYEHASSGFVFISPVSRPPQEDELLHNLLGESKKFRTNQLSLDIGIAQSLKYPITLNSEWLYRNVPKFQSIHKKVIRFEKITINSKVYDCFVVEWIYSASDQKVYDYYANIGLVKRTVNISNITISDENNFELGTADITDEYVLVGFSQAE